jgi:predicted Zn-dependent protease
VDWLGVLKVEEASETTEAQLGRVLLASFTSTERVVSDAAVLGPLNRLIDQVCTANGIARRSIEVHVLAKDDVNALALPGGHLVLFSSLVEQSTSQEALCGVICHELAHIQQRHVMKKLARELGLTALATLTAGSSGQEVLKQAVRVLSSSAFDRALEQEADLKAVDYMLAARIDPQPFAAFLRTVDDVEPRLPTWVSTHPDGEDRARRVAAHYRGKERPFEAPLAAGEWRRLKHALERAEKRPAGDRRDRAGRQAGP